MKKKIFSVFTVCCLLIAMSMSIFAHSGRTDSRGGHKDNKNKSGLGSYHYHCGGYPAHLHTGGVCPYKSGSPSSSGSGSSYSSTPQKVYASRITITNIPTKINVGETTALKASVYPADAEDTTISWESSDSDVVEVSSTGTLKAVGVGFATITAKTERGTSKKFTITVDEVFAERINISNKVNTIRMGDTYTLRCSFIPENTTNKKVEWTSSDETVISVSDNGKITGHKLGFATVMAKHNELTESAVIEVKCVDAEKIEIILPDNIKYDNKVPRLKKDDNIQLKTEISPKNTTYKDIAWSVSKEDIATIDQNGVLTAHSTGKVRVIAMAKSGITEEIELEVYSNTGKTVVGVCGIVVVAVWGIMHYKNKKKEDN